MMVWRISYISEVMLAQDNVILSIVMLYKERITIMFSILPYDQLMVVDEVVVEHIAVPHLSRNAEI